MGKNLKLLSCFVGFIALLLLGILASKTVFAAEGGYTEDANTSGKTVGDNDSQEEIESEKNRILCC